ncbi:hypothetical protein K1728_05715 [Weissella confusa]|uniref:hypothetical protein n=1 Tax=Weissella confusa TaxID=1583 RepID=UPI001C6F7144|nr:hypothetical protein [Weissella confusa]QYU58896.1 hypothetical protein K1728_05715 [Weissella confusa]
MAVAGIENAGWIGSGWMPTYQHAEIFDEVGKRGDELYTKEQIREVLIKFADECKALNGQIVYPSIDDFMEGD